MLKKLIYLIILIWLVVDQVLNRIYSEVYLYAECLDAADVSDHKKVQQLRQVYKKAILWKKNAIAHPTQHF